MPVSEAEAYGSLLLTCCYPFCPPLLQRLTDLRDCLLCVSDQNAEAMEKEASSPACCCIVQRLKGRSRACVIGLDRCDLGLHVPCHQSHSPSAHVLVGALQENARRRVVGQPLLSLCKPSAYFYIEGGLQPVWVLGCI